MSGRITKIRSWVLLEAIILTLSLGSLVVIHYREPGWLRTDLLQITRLAPSVVERQVLSDLLRK